MCGIAGFVDFSSSKDDAVVMLKRMGDTLSHRGPDDEGIWYEQKLGVGLSHRRLAVIDVSSDGHQPMFSQSGRFVIVYNGEVYNFRALRTELETKGVIFSGHSDTEILLACLDAWGLVGTLPRITGMFAFALVDKAQRTLYLVRDRMGEKPLYYGWQKGTFLFGSELKAMRQHSNWQGGVDRCSLADLTTYNYIGGPATIHPNIFKLLPGKYLSLALNPGVHDERVTTWWSLEDVHRRGISSPFSGDIDDAEAALDNLLRKVLMDQRLADVPVGVLLSGGIDSTSIVSVIQSLSEQPVRSFTIGYEDERYDESHYARSVADYLGTEHEEWIVSPNDALAVIPKLAVYYDEPFADSSQIPTALAYQLSNAFVTVTVTGDGADELFGGYSRHFLGPRIYQRITRFPLSIRKLVSSLLSKMPIMAWDSLNWIWRSMRPDRYFVSLPVDKILKLISLLSIDNERHFYSTLVQGTVSGLTVNGTNSQDLLSRYESMWELNDNFAQSMMRLDAISYLPDDILVKVDRASMAYSIESRAPFLDHRIVEFAAQLPANFNISDGVGKQLLRKALDRYVPKSLLDRPKTGFALPLDRWLRGPLLEWASDHLSMDKIRRDGYFDPQAVADLWTAHRVGRSNHHSTLWSILMFQEWMNTQ